MAAALPTIQTGFGTDLGTAQWVMNAYLVAFGMSIVACGSVADQLGRRRVFLPGLGMFAATRPPAAGTHPSRPGRRARAAGGRRRSIGPHLAGVAAGRVSPQPPVDGGGLWCAVGTVAAASGPLLGPLLVETVGWRWIFLANLPVCVLAIATGGRLLRESTDRRPPGSPTCSAWRW
jgi:MFS family permease